MLKVRNLDFSKILVLLALNMQRQLRLFFGFLFCVKFNQTLHRLISTKRLLSNKGRSSLFHFKWNLRKLSRIKNFARSALVINKFIKINIMMQIMRRLFQKDHKNKKPFFELFRTLMKINSPKTIQQSKLVFSGKKDKKSRTKTIVMGSKYQEINKFSSAHYNQRINFISKFGNEKAGSFFLKIWTDAGKWNQGL